MFAADCKTKSRADLLERPIARAWMRAEDQYAPSATQMRKASIAGVKISVKIVAIPRPNTTAVASCFQKDAVGLSME